MTTTLTAEITTIDVRATMAETGEMSGIGDGIDLGTGRETERETTILVEMTLEGKTVGDVLARVQGALAIQTATSMAMLL